MAGLPWPPPDTPHGARFMRGPKKEGSPASWGLRGSPPATPALTYSLSARAKCLYLLPHMSISPGDPHCLFLGQAFARALPTPAVGWQDAYQEWLGLSDLCG